MFIIDNGMFGDLDSSHLILMDCLVYDNEHVWKWLTTSLSMPIYRYQLLAAAGIKDKWLHDIWACYKILRPFHCWPFQSTMVVFEYLIMGGIKRNTMEWNELKWNDMKHTYQTIWIFYDGMRHNGVNIKLAPHHSHAHK